MKNRNPKRANLRMAPVNTESVPVSEVSRLLGLSEKSVKRMCSAGQLASFKTPGGHVRVPRADVERFRQNRGSASAASASSVLQNRRERVEELALEVQELRAKQEIEKLRAEADEPRRREYAATKSADEAHRRAASEARLLAARISEARKREQQQRTREKWRRGWINSTRTAFPVWLSMAQEQTLVSAVENELRLWGTESSQDLITGALARTVERVIAPWRSELEEKARREKLVETTIGGRDFWNATIDEKAEAATSVRAAISRVPYGASDSEIQAVMALAMSPIKLAMERRQHEERVRAEAAKAKADAEAKELWRIVQENVGKQKRESSRRHLIFLGEMYVETYLRELFDNDEVGADALADTEWQDELKAEVRGRIENNCVGTENSQAAKKIACEVVDQSLGKDDE